MFLDQDFLLTTPVAKKLYHEHAAKMPIIDYHCHLDPKEVYEDKNFENITQAWLYGDHYKWRLMRAHGIEEKYITGDVSDYERFEAWAKVVPYLVGNPLYAWTHLELKRFFGIDKMLSAETAKEIYEAVNEQLKQKSYSRRQIIKNAQVKLVVTTDDPVDTLEYHQLMEKEDMGFKVLPGFRPDASFNIEAKSFGTWFKKLETISGTSITSYLAYKEVIKNRMLYFDQNGCSVSDHSISELDYTPATDEELEIIFQKAIHQEDLTKKNINQFKSAFISFLLSSYHDLGWVVQFHLKALRNANQNMFNQLGPDSGYDAMTDQPIINTVKCILDRATQEEKCPKVILYSLNRSDFVSLVTLMQCFQKGGVKQNLQLGSAWWFNDTRQGMRYQLQSLAENSILYNFVGMLTDSRSFLSYTRHEYFRRVLCELIGEWVTRGEAPEDYDFLGKMVENIAFNNTNDYFDFQIKE